MNITQKFYDSLASHYDKLFADWEAAVGEQAQILQKIFRRFGVADTASVLDCACGIGTQAIGLAGLGYTVTASDISEAELAQARERADTAGVGIRFANADFRLLAETFSERFDIVIAMDNALPHMLTDEDMERAVRSIAGIIREDGIFVGSIRDYDALRKEKPPYSPPYIHTTEQGRRVSFQTWDWSGECYRLTQYIIDDGEALSVNKFECEYRAWQREELTALFLACGCREVIWMGEEKTGFYQPILVVRR